MGAREGSVGLEGGGRMCHKMTVTKQVGGPVPTNRISLPGSSTAGEEVDARHWEERLALSCGDGLLGAASHGSQGNKSWVCQIATALSMSPCLISAIHFTRGM